MSKCRQFYSASFEEMKKGGRPSSFFDIFKKLKKYRNFCLSFSHLKIRVRFKSVKKGHNWDLKVSAKPGGSFGTKIFVLA